MRHDNSLNQGVDKCHGRTVDYIKLLIGRSDSIMNNGIRIMIQIVCCHFSTLEISDYPV